MDEERKTAVAEMITKMSEASNANLEKLEHIVSMSTQKLTQTINMKLLLQVDLSQMTPSFQRKARRAIKKHFEETVLLAMGDNVDELDVPVHPKSSDSDGNELNW